MPEGLHLDRALDDRRTVQDSKSEKLTESKPLIRPQQKVTYSLVVSNRLTEDGRQNRFRFDISIVSRPRRQRTLFLQPHRR